MLLSWIEAALSFFVVILQRITFVFIYYSQTPFMKPIYFSIIDEIVTHPCKGPITKLQIEKKHLFKI